MMHMLKTYYDATYRSEEGATLVEYALLVALIAIVVITAIAVLSDGISDIFTNTGNRLTSEAGKVT